MQKENKHWLISETYGGFFVGSFFSQFLILNIFLVSLNWVSSTWAEFKWLLFTNCSSIKNTDLFFLKKKDFYLIKWSQSVFCVSVIHRYTCCYLFSPSIVADSNHLGGLLVKICCFPSFLLLLNGSKVLVSPFLSFFLFVFFFSLQSYHSHQYVARTIWVSMQNPFGKLSILVVFSVAIDLMCVSYRAWLTQSNKPPQRCWFCSYLSSV